MRHITDRQNLSNQDRLNFAREAGTCLNCLNKHSGPCLIKNRHKCDLDMEPHQGMLCPKPHRAPLSVNSIDLNIEAERQREELEFLREQLASHSFPEFNTESEARSVNSICRATYDTTETREPAATSAATRVGVTSKLVAELLQYPNAPSVNAISSRNNHLYDECLSNVAQYEELNTPHISERVIGPNIDKEIANNPYYFPSSGRGNAQTTDVSVLNPSVNTLSRSVDPGWGAAQPRTYAPRPELCASPSQAANDSRSPFLETKRCKTSGAMQFEQPTCSETTTVLCNKDCQKVSSPHFAPRASIENQADMSNKVSAKHTSRALGTVFSSPFPPLPDPPWALYPGP